LDKVTNLILIAPILLFSMVAHEYAHGWVAYKNGDPTAYQLGRLTWNPLKHIDPVRTIVLPLVMAYLGLPILGGAKPVPVQPRNFRNFKRGDIMVSLAGVTANVLIALLCAIVVVPLFFLGNSIEPLRKGTAVFQQMLIQGIWINLILAAFNLLPVPPLDGSHAAKYLLPPAWSLTYQRAGRYGFVILYALILLRTPILVWLFPAELLANNLIHGVERFVMPWPFPA